MIPLTKHYEAAIAEGHIRDDLQQRQVLSVMQRVNDELEAAKKTWFQWFGKPKVRGIYLYGPVGVGKTFLMDLFYQQVPEERKARFHFHHFMQQIDAQLRHRQGQKDPLRQIAVDLAKSYRLLCFDEFLVNDVAYAMILAELFAVLFAQGITIVITANTPPDDLYQNGVQRQRFLPVIHLIKTHCEIFHLEHKKDYRLGREVLLQTYLEPLNAKTDKILADQFASLVAKPQEEGFLMIQNRDIPYIKCGDLAVWFDFKMICNLPRSQLDYLEIASRFETIFVSNIPALTEKDTVLVILLIHLIDVLYDRGIKLVLSAAVPLSLLYVRGEMSQEFKRTQSRLAEMQAADYLQRHPWRHEDNLKDLS